MSAPDGIDFMREVIRRGIAERSAFDALFARYGYTVACQMAWDMGLRVKVDKREKESPGFKYNLTDIAAALATIRQQADPAGEQ